MTIIYPGSHESGPELLMLMGAACFFVCMALMMNAILQAGGNEKYPIYSMMIGGVVKIGVNWFLCRGPGINILGAPIGTPQLLRRNVRHGLHLPLPGHARKAPAGKDLARRCSAVRPWASQPGRSTARHALHRRGGHGPAHDGALCAWPSRRGRHRIPCSCHRVDTRAVTVLRT